jgi:hypothetical protein
MQPHDRRPPTLSPGGDRGTRTVGRHRADRRSPSGWVHPEGDPGWPIPLGWPAPRNEQHARDEQAAAAGPNAIERHPRESHRAVDWRLAALIAAAVALALAAGASVWQFASAANDRPPASRHP